MFPVSLAYLLVHIQRLSGGRKAYHQRRSRGRNFRRITLALPAYFDGEGGCNSPCAAEKEVIFARQQTITEGTSAAFRRADSCDSCARCHCRT
jgi:hypothetical protein